MARGEVPSQFNTTLHGHQVAEHQVVCYRAKIQEVMEQHAYPYKFKSTDDVPKSLADLGSGLTFVWDARAMRSIRDSAVIDPPQNIIEVDDDLADAMSDVEIIDDGDDDDNEDADAGTSFTPKQFNKDDYKFLLVRGYITQVRDFPHPLRPVDAAHKDMVKKRFMDKQDGYDESVGMMSVTVRKEDLGEDVELLSVLEKSDEAKKSGAYLI